VNLGLHVQRSVALLQANVPVDGRPYLLGYSGGKDSDAILELARMAEVPFEAYHSLTTIDPPEVVRHVMDLKGVQLLRPERGNMLHRAVEKGVFPTPTRRWCCREYKERAVDSERTVVLGIRIAESPRREERWQDCVSNRPWDERRPDGKKQRVVLPIRLWTDEDVWAFLRWRKVKYCHLYDEGFSRLGCVGCPMTTRRQREEEFTRWPKYGAAWRRMFDRLWARKAGVRSTNPRWLGLEWFGSRVHNSVDELWEWWMDRCPNVNRWRRSRGLPIKDSFSEKVVVDSLEAEQLDLWGGK
jgi:phosphoadenosine phosphosulfate reductase